MDAAELDRTRTQIEDVLMRNSSFYRASPEDETLYLLDVVALAKLVYMIMGYAATIFGATLPIIAGGKWVYDRWKGDKAGDTPAAAPPALSDKELRERLVRLRDNLKDENLRAELAGNIRQILEYHGWPATESDADAKKILGALTGHGQPA